MKIYFEDGHLETDLSFLSVEIDSIVDATAGVNSNINTLDNLMWCNPDRVVYTNSIFAFNNMYAWNKELKVPEIYIRAGEHRVFTRIDKLTNRELREGHNLAKMYVAGEFDSGVVGKLNHIKE